MTNFALGQTGCSDFSYAVKHEWLITNGIGGFACGTVCEVNTRRYHSLLTAALTPPTGRTLLVSKLDIAVHYLGADFALFSNEFADGTIEPKGFFHLEAFQLDQGLPVWRYACADALIEKRLLMQPGCNTTLINIRILRASADLVITLTPLCTYRDYHSHRQGDFSPQIRAFNTGVEIQAFADTRPYRISCEQAEFVVSPDWYWQFKHRLESARGLDDREDLFRPGIFNLTLAEGDQTTVMLSSEPSPAPDFNRCAEQIRSAQQVLLSALPQQAPEWIQQLTRASGQFIVERHQQGQTAGKTILAGYPWFTDWGRDTMIALPGLTLALGRYGLAAEILRTVAKHISAGMIPNRFPDQDSVPEYNTADATLWFIHAIGQYTQYSGDTSLAEELYPALSHIIEWHRTGTRYGIRTDPQDGLLTAGESGIQLTWMDAKVDDWVITPRIGKCVEINALWYNALRIMSTLAEHCNDLENAKHYQAMGCLVKNSFLRFWNKNKNCLFDVIDGVDEKFSSDCIFFDERIRPNQIFAVSLPHSPLSEHQQKAVVECCTKKLLTTYGLRSLARDEMQYSPYYRGNVLQRDAAYHQGTVWAWLIGPFIDAHYRVYRDAERALSFLEPFRYHLNAACLGQISEIFEAEPPFIARGCFAQAWSVGEILRIWLKLESITSLQPRLK